jgi:hypothetical protein
MLSAENKQMRGGKITASQFWKVVSLKGKLTETAITYLYEVIAEIMTNGLSIDTNEFSSRATDWGNEYEPIARKVYAEYKGVEVKLSNFTEHSLYAGCTPDGEIDADNGLLEIKCPYVSANHIKLLLCETPEDLLKTKKEYYWQCQFQLYCTGRSYVDFVSYDPRTNPLYCLHILRINRDEAVMQEVEKHLQAGIKFIKETINQILTKSKIK